MITKEELKNCGLSDEIIEKEHLMARINSIPLPKTDSQAVEAWKNFLEILTPDHPFQLHELLYHRVYAGWGEKPAPAWIPTESAIARTNIAHVNLEMGFSSYNDLYKWSLNDKETFWRLSIAHCGIIFSKPFTSIFPPRQKYGEQENDPSYLPDAELNIVESCFRANPRSAAIVYQIPGRPVQTMSCSELLGMVNRVASALSKSFSVGDSISICMPMTVECVAAYLGIIKAGMVAVSIADSFSHQEIAMRNRIANCKAIFCQDYIPRAGKFHPLFARIVQAESPKIIVIPAECEEKVEREPVKLRQEKGDVMWSDFIASGSTKFDAVITPASTCINILFSSGTTGEPKAIPWNHSSAIKSIVDSYYHHDIKPGEVVCWPTNLGWMMGPWVIFASLGRAATLSLYYGAPTDKAFCQFVSDTQVNMLGLVPSIASAWKQNNATAGVDWSCVTRYSSTGEASSFLLYLWLMSRVQGYAPVIEYCGGTEISGGYLTCTMVQSQVPAMFSTPCLGVSFDLLEDEKIMVDLQGDVCIIPPSLGMSTYLLNKSHYKVYYQDMPRKQGSGQVYRRHGDCMRKLDGGYYRAMGRSDDTIKLGGIKISSAELERVVIKVPNIREVACVGVDPKEGGAAILIIFVVMETNAKFDKKEMSKLCQTKIKTDLNPLFKVADVVQVDALPRTASNKVMRRVLRSNYLNSH